MTMESAMTTNPYAMSDDSVTATNDQLKQIGQLVASAKALDNEIEQVEERLKVLKASRRQIAEVDLPAVLDEANLSKLETPDGATVKVEEKLYMSVPKKNKAALASWLLGHGHGALVQSDVRVAFKKGDADKVQAAMDLLAENGYHNAAVEESMHTGQLKALYKELVAEGEDVPAELFGAHTVREAVIK
jgi:hypothetical protein